MDLPPLPLALPLVPADLNKFLAEALEDYQKEHGSKLLPSQEELTAYFISWPSRSKAGLAGLTPADVAKLEKEKAAAERAAKKREEDERAAAQAAANVAAKERAAAEDKAAGGGGKASAEVVHTDVVTVGASVDATWRIVGDFANLGEKKVEMSTDKEGRLERKLDHDGPLVERLESRSDVAHSLAYVMVEHAASFPWAKGSYSTVVTVTPAATADKATVTVVRKALPAQGSSADAVQAMLEATQDAYVSSLKKQLA